MRPAARGLLRFYLLGAGMMDGITGCLLMAVPDYTLELMGTEVETSAVLIYIRYIGAFVGAVGLLYLIALALDMLRADGSFVRATLLQTAVVRGTVFLFTTVAILSGQLGQSWLGVPVTDGALMMIQISLLLMWKERTDA